MRAQCKDLCGKLAEDLAAEGLRGKTITLKLKTTAFELRTRDKTLTSHISAEEDLLREALKLLRPELPITIRLMVRLLCRRIMPEAESVWSCLTCIYHEGLALQGALAYIMHEITALLHS